MLRLQHVVVQPGDPELSFQGKGQIAILMQQQGNQASGLVSKEGSTWTGPAGWLDGFRSSAGATVGGQAPDEAYVLADWVPTAEGDALARRDHKETAKTMFGTVSGDTTFILRHTPVR